MSCVVVRHVSVAWFVQKGIDLALCKVGGERLSDIHGGLTVVIYSQGGRFFRLIRCLVAATLFY